VPRIRAVRFAARVRGVLSLVLAVDCELSIEDSDPIGTVNLILSAPYPLATKPLIFTLTNHDNLV
jgi:hypothetical protein